MNRIYLVVAAAVLVGFALPAHSDDRPNVLFIVVDDLNDWIGCLKGHPQALTPNMDRLAARGVVFTNAHCVASACNPSRAAVFSGQMPDVTGVWSNRSRRIHQLQPDKILLPMAFSKAGYRTLGTGKLLHGGSGKKNTFDEFAGFEQRWSPFSRNAVQYAADELPTKGTDNPRHVLIDAQGHEVILPLNGMPSDRKPESHDGESFDWGPIDVPHSAMGDTQITDWAIERIKAGFDSPFFLGVGYYRPHIPLWAPKKYFTRFVESPGILPTVHRDDLDDLSDIGKQWALEAITAGSHATVVRFQQWRAAVEAYLACVTYVDDEIGRLLNALEDSGFANNTIVVLWSDHGWHLGEKEHWGKWTGWERSTRVPLIVVPPRNLSNRFAPAGSRCAQPVSLIDMFPTLAELCNVKTPDNLDGHSLVPLLRNPNRKTDRAVLTTFDPGNASLRTDRWRYVRYTDGSDELYDLQSDPNEWDNLAGMRRYAEQVRAMRSKLEEHRCYKAVVD